MAGWEGKSVRIRGDVAWTADDSRVTAMNVSDPASGPVVLEASAAAVWEEIAVEGPIPVVALVETMLANYPDVTPDDVGLGVSALLDELASRALITE